MKRMADQGRIKEWEYQIPDINHSNKTNNTLKNVPNGTLVYEINGPLFFATANNMQNLLDSVNEETRYIILRMSNVKKQEVISIIASLFGACL